MRRDDFQPFKRGEHGDGGGDDAVAKEQAGAGDADQSEDDPQPFIGHAALGEGHQGEDAAFAAVIGAHDQHDVFDRDHQDQRPEDQREDAQYLPRGDAGGFEMLHTGLEGVERAGADIAIDDAEHADDGTDPQGRLGARGRNGSVHCPRIPEQRQACSFGMGHLRGSGQRRSAFRHHGENVATRRPHTPDRR